MRQGWISASAVRLLPALAVVTFLAMPTPDTNALRGPSFVERDQVAARTLAQADAMVHEQAVKLGCTSQTPTLGRVCVRDAKGADSGVVRVVGFDAAYAQSKAGSVWVVGYVS